MKLNLLERILATGAIDSTKPIQGNMITFKTLTSLRNKLLITEEEVKQYNVRLKITGDNQHYEWDKEGTLEYKDIELTPFETELLANSIKLLNDGNKLTQEHESLYDKVIEFATIEITETKG